jgi:hypothetical protein
MGAGGAAPAREEQLSNVSGRHLTCATLFIDGSGGLILEISEEAGDTRALSAARVAARGQGGPVRSVARLGAGAFLAARTVAFLHQGQLVTLSAGYSTSGQLQLSRAQLLRLAKVVAGA